MAKKSKNKNELTAKDLQNFKAILIAKRNEIFGNFVKMEDETLRKERSELSTMPLHMADAGSDNFEMENTLGLMDSERKLILEIDEALHRIENGGYGICQEDNTPIPKARLEAIPWTRYCVNCAGLVETGRSGKDSFIINDYSYNEPEDDDSGNQ